MQVLRLQLLFALSTAGTTCQSERYKFFQCVYFSDTDDAKGVYNTQAAGITGKACAALNLSFDGNTRACSDPAGVKKVCQDDSASACSDNAPPLTKAEKKKGAAWGSNSGDTLDEMYSYADQPTSS